MSYQKGILVALGLYLILTSSTCVERGDFSPFLTDFSKEKQEKLGDLLNEAIKTAPDEFPLLGQLGKGDSILITYVQTLYDQANYDIRYNQNAPVDDRWNPQRKWRVNVVLDNTPFLLSLPGGHLYVSTGLLGNLKKGYEIYYLLAFETINISDSYLIDELVAEYGSSTLYKMIESPESSSFSPREVLDYIRRELEYQSEITKEIDRKAAELICETSIFDRFGIQSVLEASINLEQLRGHSSTATGRLDYIYSLNIEGCGTIKSTGLYEKMVLKNLPR